MGTTSFHICVDIKGFIRNHPDPRKWPEGMFHRDDGSVMSSVEAVHTMRALLAKGITGIPGHGCDNFDPMTGRCMGHRNIEVGA